MDDGWDRLRREWSVDWRGAMEEPVDRYGDQDLGCECVDEERQEQN